MKKKIFRFSSSVTECYLGARFSKLKSLTPPKNTVLITDQHLFKKQPTLFTGWNTIVLRAGELYKVPATVEAIVAQLVAMKVDRHFTLVGVGGGVITDLTGYVASIYMRGIRCGFVPTSLLAMVDAALGGKNGVDLGVYKNLVGTIRQPSFLLFDVSLLKTLPVQEWRNGFAEIIKQAAVFDKTLFRELQQHDLTYYQKNKPALSALISKNVEIKLRVVKKDEFEKGDRRLLNFGHTLGHALEKQYELSHGEAISIGMTTAAEIAEKLCGFSKKTQLISLLRHYGLPTHAAYAYKKVFSVMAMDKKKNGATLNYILLKDIARPVQQEISFIQLEKIIKKLH